MTHPPLAPPGRGVLSLVFWSIMVVVSIKSVIVLMRADNRGEGGSLALLALVNQAASSWAPRSRFEPTRLSAARTLIIRTMRV